MGNANRKGLRLIAAAVATGALAVAGATLATSWETVAAAAPATAAGQLRGTVNVPSIANRSQVWLLDNGTNTDVIAALRQSLITGH